ncbi:hypothetical protein GCM10009548_15670 [Streptomyces malaysiensis subsp. malaysiensis]
MGGWKSRPDGGVPGRSLARSEACPEGGVPGWRRARRRFARTAAVPVRWPRPDSGSCPYGGRARTAGRARTVAVPVRRIVRAGGRAEAEPRPG